MLAIDKFPDYKVDKRGQIFSIKVCMGKSFKKLKPFKDRENRCRVNLYNKQGKTTKFVHHLVLETFVGLRPDGMQCCHNDGNVENNNLENLRWDSPSSNSIDRLKHSTQSTMKLTENQVHLVFNAYHDGAYTQQELADLFNVSKSTIGRITRRQSWKYITNATYNIT